MFSLDSIADKAQHSSFYRWMLSQTLRRVVPFNRAHGFRVKAISPTALSVVLPYRKANLNHLKGLHACALATLSEISSGLLLLSRLNPTRYRIILKKLEMEYHYQGKTAAVARFEINDDWLQDKVWEPLEHSEKTLVSCPVEIYDMHENHLATGIALWQVKDWQAVKSAQQ